MSALSFPYTNPVMTDGKMWNLWVTYSYSFLTHGNLTVNLNITGNCVLQQTWLIFDMVDHL